MTRGRAIRNAKREGRSAFHIGFTFSDNPYWFGNRDVGLSAAWGYGWLAAKEWFRVVI